MASHMLDVTDSVVVFVDFQESYMSHFDSGKFGASSNFVPSSSAAATNASSSGMSNLSGGASSGIASGGASGLSAGGSRRLQALSGFNIASGSSMSSGMSNMSSSAVSSSKLMKISDYWTNLQAFVDLVAEFNLPTIVTEFMNTTYGSTVPQIMQRLPNAVLIGRDLPSDVIAFESKALLSAV